MIHTKKYPNGLQLIVDEMKNYESCAFHILVNTGSINENENNYGISHFIEHMLFKGTKTRSASQIVRELDSIGAHVNAYTDRTETVYYTKSTGDNVEKCVEILTDMLYNSTFDSIEMAREKKVVLEEISMYDDDPYSSCEINANSAFYAGTRYALDVAGKKQIVKRIKKQDILKYMNEYYIPANMVVSFAGNITMSKAEKLIQKYFLPQTDNTKLNRVEYPLEVPCIQKNLIKKYKDNEQSQLCISFPGLLLEDEKTMVLKVFSIAWGGGMSSVLFQTIREKLGLVYSINSSVYFNKAGGDITIHLATTDKNVPIALAEIRKQINKIIQNGIDQKNFEIAKNYYISSIKLAFENTSSVSIGNAKRLAYLNQTKTKEQMIEEVQMVTIDDVNDMLKRVYDNNNFVISYVGKSVRKDYLKYFK